MGTDSKTDRSEWMSRFGGTIADAEGLCFVTRDRDLQRDAKERVDLLLSDISEEKAHCAEAGQEDDANLFLALEMMTKAISHELLMWLLLKSDEPDAAWNELISAEDALLFATRAHPVGKELATKRIPWLERVEETVFPPQVFMSSGLRIAGRRCSICGTDYDECDHIKGRPYMGEFCVAICHGLEGREVSFVDVPDDKRCRVIQFSGGDGWRNRMTWRIEKRSEEGEE